MFPLVRAIFCAPIWNGFGLIGVYLCRDDGGLVQQGHFVKELKALGY